jgi:hypothetical protein
LIAFLTTNAFIQRRERNYRNAVEQLERGRR